MIDIEEETNIETQRHIAKVVEAIVRMISQLGRRASVHDQSKLEDHERPYFAKAGMLLKESTYGSEEYYNVLQTVLKPALEHHYMNNSHHPEHYPPFQSDEVEELNSQLDGLGRLLSLPGIPEDHHQLLVRIERQLKEDLAVAMSRVNNMTLLDIVEMYCDWWAATQRHANGNLEESITINRTRYGMAPQLEKILRNSLHELPTIRKTYSFEDQINNTVMGDEPN